MSRRVKKRVVFFRFVRSLIAITILSSLILGITLIVKETESLTPEKVAKVTTPILAKLRIKVSEEEVSRFADSMVQRLSSTNLSSGNPSGEGVIEGDSTAIFASNNNEKEIFSIAILADIQQDFINLEKALNLVEQKNYSKIFILGDITDYGDIEALTTVKESIDIFEHEYYTIPGDHDIAESLDSSNFISVFGDNHYLVEILDYKFLLLDNSANYTAVEPDLISWLEESIKGVDFILLSQPLYTEGLNKPFESIYMGSTQIEPTSEDLKEKQEIVRDQGKSILELIRNEKSVKAIFAGDHHKSSELKDPVRDSLTHYTVGAVSSTVREYPQSLIQTSRFSKLRVFEDGSYEVLDIILD